MSRLFYIPWVKNSQPGISEDWGRIPQEMKNEYWQLETIFADMFRSNGNNLARLLYDDVINQANVRADTVAGTHEGGYGNDQYNRGCTFCLSVPNQVYRKNVQDPKFRGEVRQIKKLEAMYPASAKYEELLTPAMFIFDRTDFENLLSQDLATYYLLASQSITHDYLDPNESLKETLVHNRINMPKPLKLIIGKMGYRTFKVPEMIPDWNDIYEQIITRYGDIDIIHYPNLNLGLFKNNNETGNLLVSRKCYKTLKLLLSIVDGKLKPTRTI